MSNCRDFELDELDKYEKLEEVEGICCEERFPVISMLPFD